MLNKLCSLYIISLLFVSSSTFAEQTKNWYSVEYIIFENKPLGNQSLEPWTKAPFIMPDDARLLNTHSTMQDFSLLKVDQQQLHGVLARLKKLSSYRPLAHGGWIQSLSKNSPVQAVAINTVTHQQQLEGSISFYRGKYLHLTFDLQLSETPVLTVDDNDGSTPERRLYRLKDSRRIKTSESNYFDHPRFGVIAIVEEIDSPLSATPTADISESQPIKAKEQEAPTTPLTPRHNDN